MDKKKVKYFIIVSALVILVIYAAGKCVFRAKSEFFYPTITKNVPTVNDDLEKILDEFETILKDKNPTAYDSLNQGLSARDIGQLEVKYNVKIPEEIKSLYMRHNGCGDFESGLAQGTIIPGHWLFRWSRHWN